MTSNYSVGNAHTAQRIVNAENAFLATLMHFGDLDAVEAAAVLAVYRKARVVKLDAVGGALNVKHGAFLDRDVIRRALASAA